MQSPICQLNQSCEGRLLPSCGVLRFCRASHLILETVMEATGRSPPHQPTRGASELSDQVFGVASGPVVVPQQGIADQLTLFVEGHHAVLLAADGQRRHSVKKGWIGCALL